MSSSRRWQWRLMSSSRRRWQRWLILWSRIILILTVISQYGDAWYYYGFLSFFAIKLILICVSSLSLSLRNRNGTGTRTHTLVLTNMVVWQATNNNQPKRPHQQQQQQQQIPVSSSLFRSSLPVSSPIAIATTIDRRQQQKQQPATTTVALYDTMRCDARRWADVVVLLHPRSAPVSPFVCPGTWYDIDAIGANC